MMSKGGSCVVKIVHSGRTTRHDLSTTTSFGALLEHICSLPSDEEVSHPHIQVFVGFPPSLVRAFASASLADCGIRGGMTINVRSGSKGSFSLIGSADATIAEKIGRENVWKEALEVGGDNIDLVEEVYTQLVQGSSATSSATTSGVDCNLIAKRVVIPADNSCLFNAVAYLLEHNREDVDSSAVLREVQHKLRAVVAKEVVKSPEVYSEPVLGVPPGAYATWIADPAHWGGEVEIAVLCGHYQVAIRVVDIGSGALIEYHPSRGGTEGASVPTSKARRIYLLYNGIHYDALACSSSVGASGDTGVLQRARPRLVKVFEGGTPYPEEPLFKSLAAELKQAGDYTNLTSEDTCIQCMVCFKRCAGETGATRHAMATKHQNFRQI
jgi:ubiquitin thioesterase OTU1